MNSSRTELLRDAEYFATELARRLEALARLDPHATTWQQAAKVSRRIKALTRHEIDTARGREKQLAGR